MDYRIGQLAKHSGFTVETIRYYEQRGLLQPNGRTASGYRYYGDEALQRLHFIQRAKELGFSLEEIGELLGLEFNGEAQSSRAVKALVEDKLALVDARINELQRLKQTLQGLSSCCDGSMPTSECPILAFLKEPEAAAAGCCNTDD